MRVSLGISSSQGSAAPGYTFPDPFHYEDDWTALSLPAGWDDSASLTPGDFLADGTFASTVDIYSAVQTVNRQYKATTTIIAHKVFNTGRTYLGGQVVKDPDVLDPDLTSPNVQFQHRINADQWDSDRNASTNINNQMWSPTSGGLYATAIVSDENGDETTYVFSNDGYIASTTVSVGARNVALADFINVSISPETDETAASLVYTYFGFDEVLSGAAIQTIVEGLGWVETTFVPGSASSTTSDWTTTVIAPDWTLASYSDGTAVFDPDGLYNSDGGSDILSYFLDVTPETYLTDATIILHVNVIGPTVGYTSMFQSLGGFGVSHYTDLPSTYTVEYADQVNFDSFVAAGVGDHFLSVSVSGDSYTFYFHESGETTQIGSGTVPDAASFHLMNSTEIAIELGDPTGNAKIAHTYVGENQALSQGAIETIISGWGWTP